MKMIVAGGRNFIPIDNDEIWLMGILEEMNVTEVVCGMAEGADLFGKRVAEMMGLPVKEFPANWDRYGKKAGWKRNLQMAMYADGVILFPGGVGTNQMRTLAKYNKLMVIERAG